MDSKKIKHQQSTRSKFVTTPKHLPEMEKKLHVEEEYLELCKKKKG